MRSLTAKTMEAEASVLIVFCEYTRFRNRGVFTLTSWSPPKFQATPAASVPSVESYRIAGVFSAALRVFYCALNNAEQSRTRKTRRDDVELSLSPPQALSER